MYNFHVTHASANEASDRLSGSEAESCSTTVFPKRLPQTYMKKIQMEEKRAGLLHNGAHAPGN